MYQETLRVTSEHIASEARESHRLSDPYIFAIIDGTLVYSNGRPIKDQISGNGAPFDKEYKIVEDLENWANTNQEGAFLWVSAPYPGKYPITKVIASEIATIGGTKVLVNRALTFDFSGKEAIRLANRLAPYCEKPLYFIDTEKLRQTPLFLKKDSDWISVMEGFLPNLYGWQGIREGKDFEEKEPLIRLLEQIIGKQGIVRAREVAQEQGVFGPSSISCPPTAFDLFHKSSEYRSFQCPRCNKNIPSGRGITTCPHCGARKEDYKACA